MSNSTQIITDLKSVYTNGPQGSTQANSISASGVILDYIGMTQLAVVKAEELNIIVNQLITNTDASGDATNLALLNGVVNDLK